MVSRRRGRPGFDAQHGLSGTHIEACISQGQLAGARSREINFTLYWVDGVINLFRTSDPVSDFGVKNDDFLEGVVALIQTPTRTPSNSLPKTLDNTSPGCSKASMSTYCFSSSRESSLILISSVRPVKHQGRTSLLGR